MIGATPEEPGAPGAEETWGIGREGSGGNSTAVLVRYYLHPGRWKRRKAAGRWGRRCPKNCLRSSSSTASPLAGQMTPRGFGVLVGTEKGAADSNRSCSCASPAAPSEATGPVPVEGEAEPLLVKGQHLYGKERAPMIAPLEEADGEAGALVVPVSEGAAGRERGPALGWPPLER